MTSPKKLVKLSSLKSDLKKEREGDWIKAPDVGDDVWFLVRSTNYPAYIVARDAASADMLKKYGETPVPADVNAKVNGELIAEHLLLGWKGLDVDFDPDLALEVLCDEAHRTLRLGVAMAATKVGRAEVEFVEGGSKN